MPLRRLTFFLFSAVLLLVQPVSAAPADAGKLRISADQAAAYIYINGRKKGMTGDEGFTNILLAEGEYQVKVEKSGEDDLWVYSAEKSVFVGADTSLKLTFKLNKQPSAKKQAMMERVSEQRGFGDSRYSDHGDGTVTDHKTGLMWKKCSEGLSGQHCGRGKHKRYEWAEAQAHAKKASFANRSDWRLPTRMELHSLVYCSTVRRDIALNKHGNTARINGKSQDGSCLGEGYDRPTINQVMFPNTSDSFYWSSSPYASYNSLAWIVDFGFGGDFTNSKDHGKYVRLVRGGQ